MQQKATTLIRRCMAGFSAMTVIILIVLICIALGVKFVIDATIVKNDMAKISKISSSLNYYLTQFGSLPGADKNTGKMTVATMFSDLSNAKMLTADDFSFKSVNLDLTFYGCDAVTGLDGKEYWKAAPLSTYSKICIGRSDYKIADYGKSVPDTASPYVTSAFLNSYYICQFETTFDDRNLNSDNGKLVVKAAGRTQIEKTGSFNCEDYKLEKKRINEIDSVSYLFKVY